MRIFARLIFWKLSLLAAMCFGTSYAAARSEAPVFAFTTTSPEVLAVVDRYFREDDYVSWGVARNRPKLGRRIGRDHRYKLVPSLVELSDWAGRSCGAEDTPGLVIYDNEEWEETPPVEKVDIAESIRKGARLVKASTCQKYGIAPARAFLSNTDRACFSAPRGIIHDIAWKEIDVLIIQGQGLLRDKCMRAYDTRNYVAYVSELARVARSANPNIVVFAEVSFNRSSPETIMRAIDTTKDFVDGFYLAYPKINNCMFCSVDGLERVLSRYRVPRAADR